MSSLLRLSYLAMRFVQVVLGKVTGRLVTSHALRGSPEARDVIFHGSSRIMHPEKLHLGSNVHVNFGAYWVCEGGLTIGDNCHFGKGTTIYTRNHNHRGTALPYDQENIARPVSIGKNCWIGAEAIILPGARIGEGVIIGAGTVVHGEIPALSIVGAAAPVKISERDRVHYEQLEKDGRYGGVSGKLYTHDKSQTRD